MNAHEKNQSKEMNASLALEWVNLIELIDKATSTIETHAEPVDEQITLYFDPNTITSIWRPKTIDDLHLTNDLIEVVIDLKRADGYPNSIDIELVLQERMSGGLMTLSASDVFAPERTESVFIKDPESSRPQPRPLSVLLGGDEQAKKELIDRTVLADALQASDVVRYPYTKQEMVSMLMSIVSPSKTGDYISPEYTDITEQDTFSLLVDTLHNKAPYSYRCRTFAEPGISIIKAEENGSDSFLSVSIPIDRIGSTIRLDIELHDGLQASVIETTATTPDLSKSAVQIQPDIDSIRQFSKLIEEALLDYQAPPTELTYGSAISDIADDPDNRVG